MQSPRDKSNLLRQAFSLSMHSGQLTWQWKHFTFKRTYIFKWWIFHCHVSLPEVFQYFNMCTNHKNRRSPAGASYERLRKYVLNVGGDCEGTSMPRAFVECLSCFWSGKGLGFESHGSWSSMSRLSNENLQPLWYSNVHDFFMPKLSVLSYRKISYQ